MRTQEEELTLPILIVLDGNSYTPQRGGVCSMQPLPKCFGHWFLLSHILRMNSALTVL